MPASLGALQPCAAPDGLFLIPVAAGEAVWIGLLRAGEGPAIHALAEQGGVRQPLAPAGNAHGGGAFRALIGIPEPGGAHRPFAGPESAAVEAETILEFEAVDGGVSHAARVALATPADFEARTGCPAPSPASAENGYRGWRLP